MVEQLEDWAIDGKAITVKLLTVSVESVRITTILVSIIELPNCVVWPAARWRTSATAVPRENERIRVDKSTGASSAARPPRWVGV